MLLSQCNRDDKYDEIGLKTASIEKKSFPFFKNMLKNGETPTYYTTWTAIVNNSLQISLLCLKYGLELQYGTVAPKIYI